MNTYVMNTHACAHTHTFSLSPYLYIFFGQWCPRTQMHHLIICAGSAKGTYHLFIQLNQLQMCVCFFLRAFFPSVLAFLTSPGFFFLSHSARASEKHWETAHCSLPGPARRGEHPMLFSQSCDFLLPKSMGLTN